MKQLDHPNIVKLVEVIDDPESDNFYMGVTSFSSILHSFPSETIFSFSQWCCFGQHASEHKEHLNTLKQQCFVIDILLCLYLDNQ